jgi:hypothetical protein
LQPIIFLGDFMTAISPTGVSDALQAIATTTSGSLNTSTVDGNFFRYVVTEDGSQPTSVGVIVLNENESVFSSPTRQNPLTLDQISALVQNMLAKMETLEKENQELRGRVANLEAFLRNKYPGPTANDGSVSQR